MNFREEMPLDSLLRGKTGVLLLKAETWIAAEVLQRLQLEVGQFSIVKAAEIIGSDCCFFSFENPVGSLTAIELKKLIDYAHVRGFSCGVTVDGPFERMMGELGFMAALPLFYEREKAGQELLKYLAAAEAQVAAARRAGADLIIICDDLAYTKAPYISPAHFEDLLLPCYERLKAAAGDNCCGFHSDGNLEVLLPLLKRLDFQVYSLEPEAMDLPALKRGLLSDAILMSGIKADWLLGEEELGGREKEIVQYINSLQGETGLILSSICGLYTAKSLDRLQQIYQMLNDFAS